MDNDLLFLLQALDNINGDLEDISHNVGRREGQPLGEGHIGNASRLVNLDES